MGPTISKCLNDPLYIHCTYLGIIFRRIDSRKHGKNKCSRFSSSRLRLGNHVLGRIGQQCWKSRFLNLARGTETHAVHTLWNKKNPMQEVSEIRMSEIWTFLFGFRTALLCNVCNPDTSLFTFIRISDTCWKTMCLKPNNKQYLLF